jgi:hypothetical protein
LRLGETIFIFRLWMRRHARWYRLQSSIPVLTAHCPLAYVISRQPRIE